MSISISPLKLRPRPNPVMSWRLWMKIGNTLSKLPSFGEWFDYVCGDSSLIYHTVLWKRVKRWSTNLWFKKSSLRSPRDLPLRFLTSKRYKPCSNSVWYSNIWFLGYLHASREGLYWTGGGHKRHFCLCCVNVLSLLSSVAVVPPANVAYLVHVF